MTTFLPETLTQLGNRVEVPTNPHLAHLETIGLVPNANKMLVRLESNELTMLCPVTGQPDYGKVIIDYVPSDKLIESKSLKLFLSSFRNYNCFHEEGICYITHRLADMLAPTWIRVAGIFNARGGINITPIYTIGTMPGNIYIPDLRL